MLVKSRQLSAQQRNRYRVDCPTIVRGVLEVQKQLLAVMLYGALTVVLTQAMSPSSKRGKVSLGRGFRL